MVAGFSGPPLGGARALDACQVILPGRAGPTCGGSGMTCNPRLVLVTAGAIPVTFDAGEKRMFAGVVGDGFDTVSVASVPIVGNVAAIEVPKGVDAVTMSGPAGRHRVAVI